MRRAKGLVKAATNNKLPDGFELNKHRFFKGDGSVVHFDKHGSEMMSAFNRTSYNMKNYLDDAHHTIKTGTYVPELNGFVKLIGGLGSAKYAFTGFR